MDAIIVGVCGLLVPRRLVRAAGHPPDALGRLRSALRALGGSGPVVLLESGPADDLENWAVGTGAATLTAFRLWTARLGEQARPPSRLPFRFIQRRLDIPLPDSLYVGCDDGTLIAARRSGCPTWDIRRRAAGDVPPEVIDVVEWLQEPFSGESRTA